MTQPIQYADRIAAHHHRPALGPPHRWYLNLRPRPRSPTAQAGE
jgi:hypothetical protein